jgi:hypothetical protein
MSKFFHGLHTQTDIESLFEEFGMLWINMYESVFQFSPISSNFA